MKLPASTPQLPLRDPQIPSNRDHKALHRGTLGRLGNFGARSYESVVHADPGHPALGDPLGSRAGLELGWGSRHVGGSSGAVASWTSGYRRCALRAGRQGLLPDGGLHPE